MGNDARYRLISLAWFALAVLAPVAVWRVTGSLARRSGRVAGWWRVGGRLATLVAMCTVTPAVLAFGVCTGPPAGESDGARALKAEAAPVIVALDRYRADSGTYPATLEALAGRYVGGGVLPLRPVKAEYPVSYRRDRAEYALEFRYPGPGMNVCEYRPSVARWRCQGYF